MHELSIATSLVSLAGDAARNAGNPPIEAVCIRVGDAAGVVIEALEFAWDTAREDSPCSSARLLIERVPIRVHCHSCNREYEISGPFCLRCPECHGPTPDLVAGQELDLVELIVADGTPPHRTEAPHATAHS